VVRVALSKQGEKVLTAAAIGKDGRLHIAWVDARRIWAPSPVVSTILDVSRAFRITGDAPVTTEGDDPVFECHTWGISGDNRCDGPPGRPSSGRQNRPSGEP
jgi:hypothetical protein